MGLSSALNAAATGLRTTQAGIDVVSQNVANADSIGYSRRKISPVQSVSGERTAGVRTGEIERVINLIAQKQLRLETSGAAYTALTAGYASEIDRLFGQPGSVGSLDYTVNSFTQSLQGLAGDPGNPSNRAAVLDAGTVLAGRLASLSENVQALRSEAEGRIASGITRANELLSAIAQLNGQIMSANPGEGTSPALLDERDRYITELSQLMDIQTIPAQSNGVTLITTAGLTLFSGATVTKLTFDGRGVLTPQSQYSANETARSVGTIKAISSNGSSIDIVAGDLIRSGEIAAAVELRDTTLVRAQRQLDELAAGLSRSLSDRAAPVTLATNGTQAGFDVDFTGWQPGNAITVDYRDNLAGGVPKRIILVPTYGAAPDPVPASQTDDPAATVIRVDMSVGFAAAAGAIQSELSLRGINITASSPGANTFRFLDDTAPPNTTDVIGVSAGITVTTLASGRPQLPLFVDSGYGNTAFTGSFENRSHLTGFAQRMIVNPLLRADRGASLVVYNTSPLTPQGDATRPQHLVDSLTKATRTFSAAAAVGGFTTAYNTTVTDFARRIVETQGSNAEHAKRLDEGQKVALSVIESRFAELSGVNVDQEMSQLVQLQTAYGANARVMTAVKEMLDLLLRI